MPPLTVKDAPNQQGENKNKKEEESESGEI
jgi:hypothetical protein